MNCRSAQPFLDDLARGTPAKGRLEAVKAHVSACPACSGAMDRTRRLQSLLALKRHELPPPAYFPNFTAEFHQRLAAVEARLPWWQALLHRIEWPAPALRYATATLAGALLTLGAFHWTQTNSIVPLPVAQRPLTETASLTTASAAPTPGLTLIPATPTTATEADGYVLDRIAITPASYEGGSVRF